MPDVPTPEPRRRRRRLYLVALLAVAAGAAFVLVWFQPQKLFIDDEVDEALPGLVAAGRSVAATTTPPSPASATIPAATAPAATATTTIAPAAIPAPTTTLPANSLARARSDAEAFGVPVAATTGTFTSLDHPTSGEALIVVQPDGSRLLRLEALDTDNGPDLRVVLSPAAAGSGTYDGLVEIGRLKGNKGSQNYEIPDEVDLTAIRSVVLWCERFSAPFGEAALEVVA